jgi:tetratricopeptide (TPR) repeat protein
MRRAWALLFVVGCASAPQRSAPVAARDEDSPAVLSYRDAMRSVRLSQASRPRAITQLQDAVNKDPNFWEAWYELGRLQLQDGAAQKSKDAFAHARKLRPDHVGSIVGYARAAVLAGKPGDADGPLNDTLKKQLPLDDAVDVRIALAEALSAEGHGDRALAQLRDALRLAPRNVSALNLLAQVYRDKKEYALAELVLRRTISIDGKSPEAAVAWNNLGLVALAERHDQEAFSAFDQASRINPALATSRLNKATVYLDCGDFNKALDEVAELLRADQKNSSGWLLRGVALRGLGKYEDALQAFQRAFALDGKTADALFDAASLLADPLKRPKDAVPLYQQFLDLAGSAHPKAKEASDKLAEIKKGGGK